MTGKYEIEIYNNRVHYFLTVKRNITILQGNSATGKTELVRLVSDYEENGVSSGITVNCDAPCTVLTTVDWKLRLSTLKGHIILIDETTSFLKTKEFAEALRGADNYFVIITRDSLQQLPYSVDEIYGLRNVSDSSKYKSFKKVYNEMYRLYNWKYHETFVPSLVITEDSNAGFEFFEKIFGTICQSAGGKSGIYNALKNAKGDHVLIIADGAAFGSEIEKVFRYLEVHKGDCILYAPESFEYLLLVSGLVDIPKAITEETYKFADSKEYLSWEEFYTSYLVQDTNNTIYQYNKSRLAEAYKTPGAINRIKGVMPKQIV